MDNAEFYRVGKSDRLLGAPGPLKNPACRSTPDINDKSATRLAGKQISGKRNCLAESDFPGDRTQFAYIAVTAEAPPGIPPPCESCRLVQSMRNAESTIQPTHQPGIRAECPSMLLFFQRPGVSPVQRLKAR